MTDQNHTYEWRRFFAALGATVLILTLLVILFFATLGRGEESSIPRGPYSEYGLFEQEYLEDTMPMPVVSNDPDTLLDLGYATCDFLAAGYSEEEAVAIVYEQQVQNTSYEDIRLAQGLVDKAVEHLC